MNPLASKEDRQKTLEKFAGKFIAAVSAYFVEKVEAYIKDNKEVIDQVAVECQRLLNEKLINTESLFEELARRIAQGRPTHVTETSDNWLQILISASLGDLSRAVGGAVDGKLSWVDFLKKTIFNTVWQTVLISLVDGGLGLFLTVTIEYFQSRSNRDNTVRSLLSRSKDDMVRSIRQLTSEARDNINKKIAVEIDNKKKEKCKDMYQKLNDEQKKMEIINATLSDHNFNFDAEKRRFDDILSAIYDEAKEAYSVVFGRELALQQFETF